MLNNEKAKVFMMAWDMYEESKKPWFFELTFSEALKYAWDEYKREMRREGK